MSPQFVDFNADGHTDIIAGTFDGSPHVAYGSEDGFEQPTHIMTTAGKRILFNQYWDYDKEKWTYEDEDDKQQCTSAFAFDWDADGDLDLVLGDYAGGRVFVGLNEGSNKEHKFSGKHIAVQAGGAVIQFKEKLATPRMVDWDQDGRTDLLCSTIGSPYGEAKGASVVWFRNVAKGPGQPVFQEGVTLVESSKIREGQPLGPGAGFYFDATDYDGDGDLDLLVGGKTTFRPKARELTKEERRRADQWKAVIDEANTARREINKKVREAAQDDDKEAFAKKYHEAMAKHQPQLVKINERLSEAQEAYDKLVPRKKVKGTGWLYTNVKARATDER